MANLFPKSCILFIFLVFVSVGCILPMAHAQRPCYRFLGNCTGDVVCRQTCNQKYQEPGSCMDQPAGKPRLCVCQC
ncbi:hypothetical protein ACHQM5_005874 [Ranunculus cassubicifolius]